MESTLTDAMKNKKEYKKDFQEANALLRDVSTASIVVSVRNNERLQCSVLYISFTNMELIYYTSNSTN